VIGLVFVNALLFVPAASPRLLLGQILVFIPFFSMAWGWLLWRIDCLGVPLFGDVPHRQTAVPAADGPRRNPRTSLGLVTVPCCNERI
jgi:hypothetical protein